MMIANCLITKTEHVLLEHRIPEIVVGIHTSSPDDTTHHSILPDDNQPATSVRMTKVLSLPPLLRPTYMCALPDIARPTTEIRFVTSPPSDTMIETLREACRSTDQQLFYENKNIGT